MSETTLPAGYIRSADAAEILGVSVEETRVILRFFKVETKDGPQPLTANGKPFGKPAKLYNESQVTEVIDIVKQVRADHFE